jgi:plastocyanin
MTRRAMMRRLPILVVAAATPLVLWGCGGSDDDAAVSIQGIRVLETIDIHESEYKIRPRTTRIERTAYYGVKVINDGDESHALVIDGPGLKRRTGTIGAGESKTIAVFFKREGRYRLSCPVDGHARKGMTATIDVG